jgi:hypothetical protein
LSKIKLNLKSLSIPEKVSRARQIVTALTGNADFASPQPALAQVTASVNALETAYNEAQAARQEAKAKTSAQGQKEEEVDRILSQLASYIDSASGGDETKIKNAGLDVRSTSGGSSSPGGGSTAPAALEATASDYDGQIDLRWERVEKAKSYIIEKSLDPPTGTSWSQAAVVTKARASVSGLTSGTKYWFRVAAVTTTGQTAWSDPATKIAP